MKIISWVQGRTPPAQMGRVMSFFMFVVMGMAPISASAAGWVLTHMEIVNFFVTCGVMLRLTAITALMIRPMREVGAPVAEGKTSAAKA